MIQIQDYIYYKEVETFLMVVTDKIVVCDPLDRKIPHDIEDSDDDQATKIADLQ